MPLQGESCELIAVLNPACHDTALASAVLIQEVEHMMGAIDITSLPRTFQTVLWTSQSSARRR